MTESSEPQEGVGQEKLDPAKLRGRNKTAKTEEKIRSALSTIRTELAANGGAYPANQGRLTMAEVAKRAGVSEKSFYTTKQKKVGDEVRAFVYELNAPVVPGTPTKKTTLRDRYDALKTEHACLIQSHQLTELHFQEAEAELEDAREERDKAVAEMNKVLKEMKGLKHEVLELRAQLAPKTNDNVVAMKGGRGRKKS